MYDVSVKVKRPGSPRYETRVQTLVQVGVFVTNARAAWGRSLPLDFADLWVFGRALVKTGVYVFEDADSVITVRRLPRERRSGPTR